MNIATSDDLRASAAAKAAPARTHGLPGQVILVLQGGGALGAYQTGVYRALVEAGIEPDWVIGTSIGAINASLIAGNPPGERHERMTEFWRRVAHPALQQFASGLPFVGTMMSNWMTLMGGIQPFFRPQPGAFASVHAPLGAERAGYYATGPLRETLDALIDFDRVNAGPIRLTVGAASVRTGDDALFRQPRHAARRPPRHGLGRAAAGVPGGAHRRRTLLGRRDPVQHAGRGGVRRRAAAQRRRVRRSPVEPGRDRSRPRSGR